MENPIGLMLVAGLGFFVLYRGAKVAMKDDDEQIDYMARTAWGEARGEGATGMQAVVNVIMNRTEKGGWYGLTPKEVCLKKWQFSCWNENDPNRAQLLVVDERNSAFATAKQLAALAYYGDLPDITGGAVNYHATSIKAPSWAEKMQKTAQIGNHIFYA